MEAKKSPKANLENYRSIFVLVGLVVAIGLVFVSMSFTQEDVAIDVTQNTNAFFDDEMVVVTKMPEDIKRPEPPKQVNQDVIEIVSNDDIVNLVDFNFGDIDDTIIFVDNYLDDEPDFTDGTDDPVVWTDQMPEPLVDITSFLAKNVDYPQAAIDNEIQGTVYVRFIVTKTGKVSNVEIQRGVDPLLDNEAIRVVKTMPDFTPGLQNGRPVSVWFTVPIVFQINY